MYKVTLKPGHPTGIYRRDGQEFVKGKPVELQKISKAIENDVWLSVEKVEDQTRRQSSKSPE